MSKLSKLPLDGELAFLSEKEALRLHANINGLLANQKFAIEKAVAKRKQRFEDACMHLEEQGKPTVVCRSKIDALREAIALIKGVW